MIRDNKVIDDFWQAFLQQAGLPMDTPCYDVFCFGCGEISANSLLDLVLSGQKRATTSCLLAFRAAGMAAPQAGSFSIVTDFQGQPRCVIETKATVALLFREMTFDVCVREGEDTSLASWRRNHEKFFREEGAALGYNFSEDMPILFEDFEVVYRK